MFGFPSCLKKKKKPKHVFLVIWLKWDLKKVFFKLYVTLYIIDNLKNLS